MKDKLSNEALLYKIAKDFRDLGSSVYYVGGYVRDKIMGIESKDIDVEIFDTHPEDVEDILSQYGKVNKIGASFGVYTIKGYDIDFCLPRREIKTGDKHIDFKIEIDRHMTFVEACRRRDFTMNAIMQNILTENIIDPFNGMQDIKDKRIRYVDEKTFVEDPLRGLRMCQFAGRFDFIPTLETAGVVSQFDYSHLPKERIFEEIKKGLMKSPKPSEFILNMFICRALEKILPEVAVLVNCDQNPKFHAEGHVLQHTYMVLDELAKIKHKSKFPLELMLAGLLHDVGKPASRKVTDKGVTFHGHEGDSARIASDILDRLTDDKKLKERVVNLVENHMRPNKLAFTGTDKAIRRLMRDTDIHEILLLSEADHLGRIAPEGNRPKDYIEYRKWYSEKIKYLTTPGEQQGIIKPTIGGQQLIELGFEPGPHFKEMLDYAMDLQLGGMDATSISFNIMCKYRNAVIMGDNEDGELVIIPPSEGRIIKVIREGSIKLIEDENEPDAYHVHEEGIDY